MRGYEYIFEGRLFRLIYPLKRKKVTARVFVARDLILPGARNLRLLRVILSCIFQNLQKPIR